MYVTMGELSGVSEKMKIEYFLWNEVTIGCKVVRILNVNHK